MVERQTRNQVSPGSNPPLVPFRRLDIFVLSIDTQLTRLYLAIDSGGNVSDLIFSRNCSVARMYPGEAENGVGLNRSVRGGNSVKRSERFTGPDTAIYKNYLFYLFNDEDRFSTLPTKLGR